MTVTDAEVDAACKAHTPQFDRMEPEIQQYAREQMRSALVAAMSTRQETSRAGDWMQTISGRQFWPIDPRPDEVFIEDIAHALSMMCRFNGHCERFYSVAEHSVIVSRHVPEQHALWGLLHDASEAYIADIVRPAKRYIAGYKVAENRIMAAICAAFNLSVVTPHEVERADNATLADEAAQIMGEAPKKWFLPEPPLGAQIVGLSPVEAKAAFLQRFAEITASTSSGGGE